MLSRYFIGHCFSFEWRVSVYVCVNAFEFAEYEIHSRPKRNYSVRCFFLKHFRVLCCVFVWMCTLCCCLRFSASQVTTTKIKKRHIHEEKEKQKTAKAVITMPEHCGTHTHIHKTTTTSNQQRRSKSQTKQQLYIKLLWFVKIEINEIE